MHETLNPYFVEDLQTEGVQIFLAMLDHAIIYEKLCDDTSFRTLFAEKCWFYF